MTITLIGASVRLITLTLTTITIEIPAPLTHGRLHNMQLLPVTITGVGVIVPVVREKTYGMPLLLPSHKHRGDPLTPGTFRLRPLPLLHSVVALTNGEIPQTHSTPPGTNGAKLRTALYAALISKRNKYGVIIYHLLIHGHLPITFAGPRVISTTHLPVRGQRTTPLTHTIPARPNTRPN